MTVTQSRHASIVECPRYLFALATYDANPFIHDRAISRHARQCFTERRRRSLNVIQKSKLAKIEVLGKPYPQKVVLQCVCDQIEKLDLLADGYPSGRIVDLLLGQPGPFEERFDIDARLRRPRMGSPCDPAGCG